MRPRFRHLATTGAIALSVALLVAPTAPAATTQTSPHWRTGKVNIARASGSETTYYVMQRLMNLYNQSSIFGCTLQSVDLRTCNLGADTADTDVNDNYDRNEVLNGAGIGSSGGIGQLCGTKPTGGLLVDWARSSRVASTATDCADVISMQFAKDGLPLTVWSNEIPPGGNFGPVAAGWKPGVDPVTGPYTGTPFNNITTNDHGGGVNSVGFRLYCATDSTRITDWGQLTNLNPADTAHDEPGEGTPFTSPPAPIVIWGLNTLAGTYGAWNSYIGCTMNTNAASNHIVQENNGPQVRQTSNNEFPGNAEAAGWQVARSLYPLAYSYYVSNPYTRGGAVAIKQNGVTASSLTIINGTLPTNRLLYNVYRKGTLRGSVAGFLNWISFNDSTKVEHGVNLTTGKNYMDEINNAISTAFGMVRQFSTCPSGETCVGNGAIPDTFVFDKTT